MKRTQVFLPDVLLAELEELKKSKGVSKGEIIRRAIEDYLKKVKNENK